jgi:beta-aspartyl-peptidase (threonine type)
MKLRSRVWRPKGRNGASIAVHGGAGDWAEGTDRAAMACQRAVLAAQSSLDKHDDPVEAACAAVRVLEDEPVCNAGTGAVRTIAGSTELDASVMDGRTLSSGAVAAVSAMPHPIDLARLVMQRSTHALLVGGAAVEFGRAHGYPSLGGSDEGPQDQPRTGVAPVAESGNTVGAVVRTIRGELAAATSTGGISGQLEGRVGDSAIVGAGTYADRERACSCTGDGEAFARGLAAFWVVEADALSIEQAISERLEYLRTRLNGQGGMIVVERTGGIGMGCSMRRMPFALSVCGGPVEVGVFGDRGFTI